MRTLMALLVLFVTFVIFDELILYGQNSDPMFHEAKMRAEDFNRLVQHQLHKLGFY